MTCGGQAAGGCTGILIAVVGNGEMSTRWVIYMCVCVSMCAHTRGHLVRVSACVSVHTHKYVYSFVCASVWRKHELVCTCVWG